MLLYSHNPAAPLLTEFVAACAGAVALFAQREKRLSCVPDATYNTFMYLAYNPTLTGGRVVWPNGATCR